jgi:hypothetical protein
VAAGGFFDPREKIMSEASRKAAMRSAYKLMIVTIVCMLIGVYVGKTLSTEAPRPPQAGVAAASQPAPADAGYLPAQVVNRAKDFEVDR